MFRLTTYHGANALVIKVEGEFRGEYAENTRTLVAGGKAGMQLVVDLTDVTFVDSVGEEVLSFLGRLGAEFVADTAYLRDLCERLKLPFQRTAKAASSDIKYK